MTDPAPEEPLPGGNVSGGVVRVGDSVRRPGTAASSSVLSFLAHLEAVGFDGAPRPLGVDERGRTSVEFVAGPVAHDLGLLDVDGLARVGRLMRELHDAAESYVPGPGAVWDVVIEPDERQLVCHHDLAPWNLVLGAERWVFIDWDGAGPGSRLWDLAYAAHGFVGLAQGGDPDVDAVRLAALVAGYGLGAADRSRLVDLLPRRIRSMHDLLVEGHRSGVQPWARLYDEGHAEHWGPAAEYAAACADRFRAALFGR